MTLMQQTYAIQTDLMLIDQRYRVRKQTTISSSKNVWLPSGEGGGMRKSQIQLFKTDFHLKSYIKINVWWILLLG